VTDWLVFVVILLALSLSSQLWRRYTEPLSIYIVVLILVGAVL